MKLQTLAVPFAVLLLVAPLAVAETTSAAGTSATPQAASTHPASQTVELADIFAAPEESAPAQPDCAEAEAALFQPAPSERQAGSCGVCSDTICQGKQFGQFCKFQGGRYYYCRPAYVVCAPNDCQCWTGPLP